MAAVALGSSFSGLAGQYVRPQKNILKALVVSYEAFALFLLWNFVLLRNCYVAVELLWLWLLCCWETSWEELLCCLGSASPLKNAVLLRSCCTVAKLLQRTCTFSTCSVSKCCNAEELYYALEERLCLLGTNVLLGKCCGAGKLLCCWQTSVLLRFRCPLGVLLYSIADELLCCRVSTVLLRKDCAVEVSKPRRSNCGDEGMVFHWGSTVLFCWRITVPMRNNCVVEALLFVEELMCCWGSNVLLSVFCRWGTVA